MSTWYEIDDEVTELVDEIGKRLHMKRAEVVAIAIALLAARMRLPVVESE